MLPDSGYWRATSPAPRSAVSAAYALSSDGVYLAHNKHSVVDLAPRLPTLIKARTLHGHGLKILHQYRSVPVTLEADKARLVAGLVLGEEQRSVVFATARVWDAAREANLLVPTAEQADLLADDAQ